MRAHAPIIGLATVLVVAACASDDPIQESAPVTTPAAPATTAPPADDDDDVEHDDHADEGDDAGVDPALLLPAYLGAAPFQDVAVAEAAGWASTLETLGCFEQPGTGGMGVHWLNESLLDATVDAAQPEALVYEFDADGGIAGLVGHEYLVPLDAWTGDEPPTLFGLDFHPHPVLPFWILHAYLWKDNPNGMFSDWNPAIRMCPEGVPVFGEEPTDDQSDTEESAGPAASMIGAR